MDRPRRSRLTDADRAAWASYAGRIPPLPGRSRPQPPASPDPPTITPPASAPPAILPPRPRIHATARASRIAAPPLAVGDHPGGVDSASWQRLRAGKLPPGRVLDLHGQTAQRAFHALMAFLRTAHADRLRCVEVITGHGNASGGGVLRRELPLWLNLPDIRPMVLAAAHPHATNPGAVRLLLRRMR
jgi:DNA-nicking Smr family endonuclease